VNVQVPIARAFVPFLRPARFKGSYGGRGSGKSYFWAGQAVEALLDGRNVLCIREVQNSIADSVKRLMEARIEEFGLQPYFRITDKEIRCPPSGAVCIFRGMQNHTAASIKSLEGFDVAWWEEAQTASQLSLDLLIPTIRKPGSELWFSWNPNDERDPIDQFLRANPPDGAVVRQINWSDNPWFPEELRADMERDRQRNPDKYLHIWEGRYQTLSEARVFRSWRIDELTPPENVVWHYGADFGFTNDPSAGLRCCLIGDDRLYVDHEVYEVGVPMEALPAFFGRLPDARLWEIKADNARPETIDYCRRNGLPKMRPVRKGPGSVEDGISFLQGREIVVHPRCVNLARELGAYAYKVDKRTGEIRPEVEDANNHLIDALRYACERVHRKGRLVAVEADVKPERRADDYLPVGHDDEVEEWRVV
jgi:phage terminase large subunit